MASIPAHNPLTVPVIIDADGRQLGGGEWGQVDPDLELVRDAESAQRLILFPAGLPDDADPAILAAVYPTPSADGDASAPDPSAVDGDDEPESPKSTAKRGR